MTFQQSPGVVTREIDGTLTVPSISVTEAAFAGKFQWGPINSPTLVTSQKNLVSQFGKPNTSTFRDFYMAHNFLDYSNAIWVVRVADTGNTKNATDGVNPAGSEFRNSDANTITITASGNATNDLSASDSIVIVQESNTDNYVMVTVTDTPDANTIDITGANLNEQFGSNVALQVYKSTGYLIENNEEYDATGNTTLDDYGTFAARHAGALGTGIKVSVCPSAAAFSQAISQNTYIGVGSSTNTTVLIEGSNTVANTFVSNNESLFVYNGASRTITGYTVDGANTLLTVSSGFGTTATTLKAKLAWEYYNEFDVAPGTSTYVSNKGGINDEMHLVVVDNEGKWTGTNGQVLERFPLVSKAANARKEDGTSNYYYDVINQSSAYVRWLNHPTSNTTNWGSEVVNGMEYGNAAASFTRTLYGGADAIADIGDNEYITGYNFFKDAETYDVSFIIGGSAGQTLTNYIIDNICEVRKDCVGFFTVEENDVVNNTSKDQAVQSVTYRDTLTSTSYAHLDGNWKYQYDAYNDVYRWLPLNADCAGIYARTAVERDPWFSGGGYNRGRIKNVVKLAYNPVKAERDELYKNSINPIFIDKGEGAILLGDKTMLSKPSAFDRMNVRILFNVLKKSIAIAAKYILMEFNDPFVRAQFVSIIDPYLRDVQGRQGITDYSVICDESNNTGEVIDRNELIGDILIKPARSINYITLNFVAVGTDVDFNEFIGRV